MGCQVGQQHRGEDKFLDKREFQLPVNLSEGPIGDDADERRLTDRADVHFVLKCGDPD